MSQPKALEWDKEGDGVRTVRASDELPAGVELKGIPAPRVSVQKRTRNSEPEDWVEISGVGGSVSVSGILVVDSVADNGTTVLGTNQAVQFQLDKDTGTQPDETDEPTPGAEYRVVVVADRDDVGDWTGKVPLIIHF